MKFFSLVLASSGLGLGSAHTIFVQLEAAGTTNPIGHAVRVPSYDGPQTDVTSNNIACNGPPNPTKPSDQVISVKAGSNVTAIWRHTLTSGPGDVMDASHKGPTMAYLKKVTNVKSDTGVGGGWFKIQEAGLSGTTWGTDAVIKNSGKHSIQIPSCIEDGQYLLRAEMIALHGARSPNGAQLYMECAQIEITGGAGTKRPQTYSIPGIYKTNDPGILVDIYGGLQKGYTIPGPAAFTC